MYRKDQASKYRSFQRSIICSKVKITNGKHLKHENSKRRSSQLTAKVLVTVSVKKETEESRVFP